MKNRIAVAFLGAAFLSVFAVTAAAFDREPGEWDAGIYAGAYFPDPSELDTGATGGVRIGYRLAEHLALSGSLGYTSLDGELGPTKPKLKLGVDATLFDFDIWYIFRPQSRFSLMLGAGPGWSWVDGTITNNPNNISTNGHETDDGLTANVAFGPLVKFDTFNVRLMTRMRYFDNRDQDDLDKEVTLALEIPLGSKKVAPPPVVAAPAPAPKPAPVVAAKCSDGDNDGVCDDADQCPNTPAGARVGKAGCDCDYTLHLQFAFNSADLTAADKAELDTLAALLVNPKLGFIEGTIDGHTDSVGPAAYNMGLSERRANSVASYLQSKGAAQRFVATGHGEDNPVASNDTDEGRAQNRRVVVSRTDCSR